MGKREYIIFLGMIFELVGLVIFFLYAGQYIDQKLHLSGIGVTTGGILAIVIWVWHLMVALKSTEAKEADNKNNSNKKKDKEP